MKVICAIAVLSMLILATATAGGEMTEYERGVANGLKIGFFMGDLYGRGQYAADAAKQFNDYLDRFHQFLEDSFRGNQTLIDEFDRSPLPLTMTAYSPSGEIIRPDGEFRIFGYPADAYYTAVGAVPGTSVQNPHDGMSWH